MLKNFVDRLMHNAYLLDEPGDTGTGGSGNGDGHPSADNGGKPQGGDGEQGGKKPNDGTPPAGKLEDDPRYRGMMSDLQKERKARQQYDSDLRAAKAELEQERKRVQALAGVNPKSADEEGEAQIRERLERMYPGLGKLTVEDIQAMKEMQTRLRSMEEATLNTWRSHGQKMLDSVTAGVTKALGGKLSERQAARVQQAYVEEAKADPKFLQRHEAGDPRLVAEFVAGWIEDFVEPGRRSALQTEVARRPRVPGGKDRSVVGSDNKPIDVKDDKAVEDMLVASFRSKGGQFGRR